MTPIWDGPTLVLVMGAFFGGIVLVIKALRENTAITKEVKAIVNGNAAAAADQLKELHAEVARLTHQVAEQKEAAALLAQALVDQKRRAGGTS